MSYIILTGISNTSSIKFYRICVFSWRLQCFMFSAALCDPVTLLRQCICGCLPNPPSWPALQPVCCVPYGAQHSVLSQTVWLDPVVRGCVAITSFSAQSSSLSCDLAEGKCKTTSGPSLTLLRAAPLGTWTWPRVERRRASPCCHWLAVCPPCLWSLTARVSAF